MSSTALGPMACDGEEMPVPNGGDGWRMAWHPPGAAPPGTPHGANAFCVTGDGDVVLISSDGSRWGWPGGRPEHGESWEDTLRREMLGNENVDTARSVFELADLESRMGNFADAEPLFR